MVDNTTGETQSTAYFALIVVQFVEAIALIWGLFPTFYGMLLVPGAQSDFGGAGEAAVIAVILLHQATYWFRMLRVPTPTLRPNVILNHLLMFASRLSFIFGAAFFSTVFFRHLPALSDASSPILLFRAVLFVGGLFTLFCFTLELERLAAAWAAKPEQ